MSLTGYLAAKPLFFIAEGERRIPIDRKSHWGKSPPGRQDYLHMLFRLPADRFDKEKETHGTEKIVGSANCGCPFRLLKDARDGETRLDP